MSTEYEIIQKENELLHSQMESVRWLCFVLISR